MPPVVAAGKATPNLEPSTVSFLPPATAMQQLPVLKGAMTSMPALALYASMNCTRCVAKSVSDMSCHPPSGSRSASYMPNCTEVVVEASAAVAHRARAATRSIGWSIMLFAPPSGKCIALFVAAELW